MPTKPGVVYRQSSKMFFFFTFELGVCWRRLQTIDFQMVEQRVQFMHRCPSSVGLPKILQAKQMK